MIQEVHQKVCSLCLQGNGIKGEEQHRIDFPHLLWFDAAGIGSACPAGSQLIHRRNLSNGKGRRRLKMELRSANKIANFLYYELLSREAASFRSISGSAMRYEWAAIKWTMAHL